MRDVVLPGGERVPALGLGTWHMGERGGRRAQEAQALQLGVELGMRLVDTAEMYGDGATETLVGEALGALRDDIFLVSKVYPHNASRAGVAAACERSLKRLRTDRIDLYLLHWRGSVPLEETVRGFEDLQSAGKIRYWGVSNFDTDDMEELIDADGGAACAANQILYNVTRRGVEYDLLPWHEERQIPVMAYSPIEQGRLPASGGLAEVADRHGVSRFQAAIAWTLRRPGVISIPKAASPAHVRENRAAADLRLDDADLAAIDASFAPPARRRPLEML